MLKFTRQLSIVFFSGLIEDNETPDMSAIRELKECTGFSGVIKKIGPVLAMDPGASNCSMRLVTIEVCPLINYV